MLKLYSYYRSSTSFRARIVLNLKQLSYETIPVHLLKDGGQQFAASYLALNPSAGVPILDHDGHIVTQSFAICEYLNDIHPEPPLYPAKPIDRAWVRSVCNIVACDMHPINNLCVQKYLVSTFGADEAKKMEWIRHWAAEGFQALEKVLAPKAKQYCFGDTVTMADAFVVPQVFGAYRFNVPMHDYPTVERVYKNAMQLPAFQHASPQEQPDAEKLN